jgi:hypothetical protein
MKPSSLRFPRSVALAVLLSLPATVCANDILMRLSVKFILSPAGMFPCCGNGTFDSFADITNQVMVANQKLRAAGRGYQFQIWEIATIGGVATNFWDLYRADKALLEQFAEANPSAYRWRNNAINIYVTHNDGSAACSLPDEDIIVIGQNSRDTTLWHESGHYFNLRHTHEGQQLLDLDFTACTNGCSCLLRLPGNDDACGDTLPDLTCWQTQDGVARGNFNVNYSALSAANQTRVDNVLNNIMSYHDDRDRITSDQLDRWTDAANGPRSADVTGRTRFVDRAYGGVPAGSSTQPYNTLALGVSAASASGTDIVLLRPGNYNEPQTIRKPLCLRATRGDATIGRP